MPRSAWNPPDWLINIAPGFRALREESTPNKVSTIGPSPARTIIDEIQDPTYHIREWLREKSSPEFGPNRSLLPSDLLALLGQDLTSPTGAGLPFAAVTKGKPVYRGQGSDRPVLDPKYYETRDLLGWMTHFAEDPNYAARYAEGTMKSRPTPQPNMFAAILPSKNTLDLINPNPDDLSAVLAAFSRSEIDMIMSSAKTRMKYDEKNFQEAVADSIRDFISQKPEVFKKTQFDAIRYSDIGHPSWAIPEEVLNKATTPWGVPIQREPVPTRYGVPETPRFFAGPEGIEDIADITRMLRKDLESKPRSNVSYMGQKPTVSTKKYLGLNPIETQLGYNLDRNLFSPGNYSGYWKSNPKATEKFIVKDNADSYEVEALVKNGFVVTEFIPSK